MPKKKTNAHGGDRRSGQRYGFNAQKYECRCEWCFVLFAAARPEARTCEPAHRAALARYVRANGKKPDRRFGLPAAFGRKDEI